MSGIGKTATINGAPAPPRFQSVLIEIARPPTGEAVRSLRHRAVRLTRVVEYPTRKEYSRCRTERQPVPADSKKHLCIHHVLPRAGTA